MTSPPEPPSRWTVVPGRPAGFPDARWHDPGPAEAAVRALERASSGVTDALRRLGPAEDVDWVGGPAARYRRDLDGLADRLRAARSQAEVAVSACAEHAAWVRRQAMDPLGEATPTWWARPGLIPGLRDR